MSDTNDLSTQEAAQVGGGITLSCSAQDLIDITTRLAEAYENLIGFTTYVIERVAGEPPPQP